MANLPRIKPVVAMKCFGRVIYRPCVQNAHHGLNLGLKRPIVGETEYLHKQINTKRMKNKVNEALQSIVDAPLKKGMKLTVEVEDVFGKDIMKINVDVNDGGLDNPNPALIKLLLTAGYSNPWLKKLIEATCNASEYIKIDGVRFQAPNNA